MRNKKSKILYLSVFLFPLFFCTPEDNVVVFRQITGPMKTNCYLIYDSKSKEAALFDVGGPIDSLVAHINNTNLNLKYIFATHCHIDHIEGEPHISDMFPDALLCYNKKEYEDFLIQRDWVEEHYDPKQLEKMKQNSNVRKWFEYDMDIFNKPDIYIEDNQIYRIGNLEIKTILSPGHSRGHICFLVGHILLAGDVFGNTNFLGGSKEVQIQSVKRLFRILSEKTTIYPGHGSSTDIESIKKEKKWINLFSEN